MNGYVPDILYEDLILSGRKSLFLIQLWVIDLALLILHVYFW